MQQVEPTGVNDEINEPDLYKPKCLQINLLHDKFYENRTYSLRFSMDIQLFVLLNNAFEYLKFHQLLAVQPYRH
ncbi:hypothetical protein D3C85_1096610 [compost metagenome]